MSDLATYLAGLKAGDVVTIDTGGRYVRQEKVERVTPTTAIVAGDKYRRTGGAWSIGKKIQKVSSGRNDRWRATWRIQHPNKASDRLREQARATILHEVRMALSVPLTLASILDMRAALDRAEAALREGEE